MVEGEEVELDPEASTDLEAAMQEAVEAVDRVREKLGEEEAAGDSAAPATAERDEEGADDLEEVALQTEIADLRDRSARALADFDNYRKRIERERQEERRFAAFEVVGDLLSVIDNLERALASTGPAEDLKAGLELILRQMHDLLRSHGVKKVPAEGEEFDPNLHDAVSRHEDPQVEVPTVGKELQAGYLMHGRLLRSAIVRVAMPVEAETADEDESEEPVQ